MSLFHIHKWSRWGDPFEQPRINLLFDQQFAVRLQRRECVKCGQCEEREL